MQKSTGNTRIILTGGITESEVKEFERAFAHLKDTVAAMELVLGQESLVLDDRQKFLTLTASMRSMAHQLFTATDKAMFILSY